MRLFAFIFTVAILTIGCFMLEHYAEGGFLACIDPAPNGGYEAAVGVFNSFRVGDQTRWNISTVKSCSEN